MGKRSRKKTGTPVTVRTAFPKETEAILEKATLLRVALIVLAGFLIYWPALDGGWIWDDHLLITNNPLMADPYGLAKIWFQPGSLFDYFPLKVTVEWIECHLWGDQVFGYHLVTLLLHLTGALLVWKLLARLGLREAWIGGLIFTVHPVMVESVAWISELKNTLSLPPLLLAMCVWINYDEHRTRRDYFLALGLFVAAMLCKTTVVMFPVVILLYAWWKRGRIGWKDCERTVPFFAVSLVLGLTTVWFLQHHAIANRVFPMGDAFVRLARAGLSIAFYFSKCLWPVGLMPIYPQWKIDPPSLIQFLPWPVLLALFYWFWRNRQSWGRHALLGVGFFLINLAPFAGFIAGSYMDFTWVMDHLLYLPIIGLIGLAVAGWERANGMWPLVFRPYAAAAGLAVLVLLGWGSRVYAGIFIDEETFWTYALERNPDAWPAHNNLGSIMGQQSRPAEALAHFQEVILLNPGYAEAHNNLANALGQTGRVPEAIEEYKTAIRLDPHYLLAHSNLGYTYAQAGHPVEAIAEYEEVLKLNPENANARQQLAQLRRLPASPAAR